MRKILKPVYNSKDVYLTCISRVRNFDLKNRLELIAENISDAANEYDHNAQNSSFFRISTHENVGGITKGEMEKIYTSRMAKKGAPGRPVYDKLKSLAQHDICPLCGQRTVSTLDHYLPKTSFPSLVVVPFNLVPACSDCNKIKLSGVPVTAEEQTLHPYYDNVTNEQWLFAEIIEGNPVSIRFFTEENDNWDDTLNARIKEHFTTFQLNSLYISQAGTEFSNIRSQLNHILETSDTNSVREHLLDGFNSRYDNHVNSWQTAMYKAMSESNWFCSGGFNAI